MKEKHAMETLFIEIIKFTVLIALIVNIGTLGNTVNANTEPEILQGTWNGQMIGQGSISQYQVKEIEYEIEISSNLNGNMEGYTSHGEWIGEYDVKYTVSVVNLKEEGVGRVRGEYTLKIDDSGSVKGEATADVSGVLNGKMNYIIEGSKTESGVISGTWSGTLITDTLTYGGTGIPMKLEFNADGEFEATIQETETSDKEATQTIEKSTTATTSEIETQIITESEAPKGIEQNIILGIVTIIAVICIGGIYYLRKRKAQGE